MSRTTGIALFLLVAISIIAAMHYYMWARFVRDTLLPMPWRGLVTGLIVTLGLAIVATPLLYRALGASLPGALVWAAYVWMGLMFVTVVVLGGFDVLRLASQVFLQTASAAAEPADLERRLALARMFGGAAALSALGVGGLSLYSALRKPSLKRVAVPLARLPRALDGLTIVQISDLHVGPTIRRDYVADVVQRTNALTPDLIVITGDLVDGSVSELAADVAPLAALSARLGVFFVTGNHEYYSGVDAWLAHLPKLGVRVLRNERILLGQGEDCFYLAGVDDWTAHQFGPGHGADLGRALAGCEPHREVVLLAHQPKQIFAAAEHKVGLVLSGHTHGGQIWPFGFLVRLVQPYVAGLAKHQDTHIYVSRGTGFWGPPMRLAAPSELTQLTLRCGERAST